MPRRRPRETTPLLSSGASNVSSDAAATATPSSTASNQHNRWGRRLFGKPTAATGSTSSKDTPGTRRRRRRAVDTRPLPGTEKGTASTTRIGPTTTTTTSPWWKPNAPANTTSKTKTPPPLRENTKDSRKKQRPIPVPTRRRMNNNHRSNNNNTAGETTTTTPPRDPPAHRHGTTTPKTTSIPTAPDAPSVVSSCMEESTAASTTTGTTHTSTATSTASKHVWMRLGGQQDQPALPRQQQQHDDTASCSTSSLGVGPLAHPSLETTSVDSYEVLLYHQNSSSSSTHDPEPAQHKEAAALTTSVQQSQPAHDDPHAPSTSSSNTPTAPPPSILSDTASVLNDLQSTEQQQQPQLSTSAATAQSSIPPVRLRPTSDSADSAPHNPRPTIPKNEEERPKPNNEERPARVQPPPPPKHYSPAGPPQNITILPKKPQSQQSTPTLSQQQQQQPSHPTKSNNKTKALLSRPFGRHTLPNEIARKWVVEVSSAEWDADRWKYRLLVQSRQLQKQTKQPKNTHRKRQQQCFTTAFTWRTVADFVWLHQALQDEYAGGLLLPTLLEEYSAASTTTNGTAAHDATASSLPQQVPAQVLRHWLSDVLNGVRGQGEVLVEVPPDLLQSASMEAFLYKNDGPAAANEEEEEEDPVQQHPGPDLTWLRPFTEALCAGPVTAALTQVTTHVVRTPTTKPTMTAMGVGYATELIQAAQVWSRIQYQHCQVALVALQTLRQKEQTAGTAWKRLAISLSNLFAFEKDVAKFKLSKTYGGSSSKIANRKVAQPAVDEGLRVLARAKVDRAIPALQALEDMLQAFRADLGAVPASVQPYQQALQQMNEQEEQSTSQWEKLPQQLLAVSSDLSKTLSWNHHEPTDRRQYEPQVQQQRNEFWAREKLLRQSLTTQCRATPIRVSRMAWRYLHTEASHGASVHSSAVALRTTLAHRDAPKWQNPTDDAAEEAALLARIWKLAPAHREPKEQAYRLSQAETIARERTGGRWDANLAMAILDAAGVDDPNVRVEETTRELRMVRKYAIGLREHLHRCVDAVQMVREAWESQPKMESARQVFWTNVAKVFSGSLGDSPTAQVAAVLSKHGIDCSDPFGWTQVAQKSRTTFTQGRVGDLVHAYFQARDSKMDWLLQSLSDLLKDYHHRIEIVEGFVYMECVGIQIEKHFSLNRAKALSAFEKKTDITSAINVAMKKRLPQLLAELQNKLEAYGPEVSQTSVKEAKDLHLVSKTIKSELHNLAMRRLLRARETSTDRVIDIMELWAKEEESASARELKALGEAMTALERSVGKEDFDTLVYRFSKRSTKEDI